MQITRLTPRFGAAITGVQPGNLDDAQFAAIKQAWHQLRGLLAFPKQQVSDDGLLVFSRRLGQLDSPPNQEHGRQSPEGYPEIYVVSNVKDNVGRPIGALGDGNAPHGCLLLPEPKFRPALAAPPAAHPAPHTRG